MPASVPDLAWVRLLPDRAHKLYVRFTSVKIGGRILLTNAVVENQPPRQRKTSMSDSGMCESKTWFEKGRSNIGVSL